VFHPILMDFVFASKPTNPSRVSRNTRPPVAIHNRTSGVIGDRAVVYEIIVPRFGCFGRLPSFDFSTTENIGLPSFVLSVSCITVSVKKILLLLEAV
jgi:hypothetical protein